MDMIQTAVNYWQLPRPTWAEIDLDAIENNIDAFLNVLGKDVSLIVAAKGNGYGHGMLPIAKLLESKDIYGFATGNIYEAIQMRKAGIRKPIQLFAHNFPETAGLLVEYGLMPSFVNPGDAAAYAAALGRDTPLKVWVKCDTGLGRLGLHPNEVLPMLAYIQQETAFQVEGLYTHIGPVDSSENPQKEEYNHYQMQQFRQLIQKVEDAGYHIPKYQFSSTYAAQRYSEAWYNAVCVGTALFADAQPRPPRIGLGLENCLKGIHSRLISTKTLAAGNRCLNRLMERETRIGIVPFGSCDGFSTRNAGKEVLLCGVRCPVMAVCLEYTVLDITAVPQAQAGDIITFLGENGGDRVTVDEYCRYLGITEIEFWCSLSYHSFPHIYVKNNAVSEIVIYS